MHKLALKILEQNRPQLNGSLFTCLTLKEVKKNGEQKL